MNGQTASHAERTEFGERRVSCDCERCTAGCRTMPGFLIPTDLVRLLPADGTAVEWAEQHLRASEGGKALRNGEVIDIPTIVPAQRTDGSCVFLDTDGHCTVHAAAPYGCAFFKACDPTDRDERFAQWLRDDKLKHAGYSAIYTDMLRDEAGEGTAYRSIWRYLTVAAPMPPPTAERKAAFTALLEEIDQRSETHA